MGGPPSLKLRRVRNVHQVRRSLCEDGPGQARPWWLLENRRLTAVDWGSRMNIIRALAADFLSIPRAWGSFDRARLGLADCIDARKRACFQNLSVRRPSWLALPA